MVKLNNILKALISCYLVLLQVYSGWCQGISQAVVLVNNAAGQDCDGVLVSLTHTVTAAHCLPAGTDVTGVNVATPAVGATAAVTSAVTTIVIHPNYNPTTLDGDAAVLTLTKARAAGTSIAPLCTVTWQEPNLVIVYAWRGAPATLNTIPMRIRRRDVCKKMYPNRLNIGHLRMFCAHGNRPASCFPPRGSPVEIKGQFCGITSFNLGCMVPARPGIFINTGSDGILSWIQQLIE